MTLNLRPGDLGTTGGSETTPELATVVNREVRHVETDIARLTEQLGQTRRVKAIVAARIVRIRDALARLESDHAELAAKEDAERRILRDRRVVLLDLQAEIE